MLGVIHKSVETMVWRSWVSRDLKPQNLLLKLDEGLLKVADMGLGRVLRPNFKAYTNVVIMCQIAFLLLFSYTDWEF